MYHFLYFFIAITLTILMLTKVTVNHNLIKVISTKDNIEYVVRDLSNSHIAANKLAGINTKVLLLINNLNENRKGVNKLKSKYNPKTLSETEKGSIHTSYSVNKGERISLCIRNKDDDSFIENDNVIIFVMIHELAHIMTESIGHTKEFWDNMKFLLEEANKLNIYTPIDYSINNMDYCGMIIKSTPYDFKK